MWSVWSVPGALELVTLAARHSNDTMKRVDKFKQLLEIQENISGGPDLVSPTRQLLKEGKICKISARSGDHQERYLFLVRPEFRSDTASQHSPLPHPQTTSSHRTQRPAGTRLKLC